MFCGSFVNKDSSLININNNSAVPCINNQILSMSGKRFMRNKTVPGAVICVIFKNLYNFSIFYRVRRQRKEDTFVSCSDRLIVIAVVSASFLRTLRRGSGQTIIMTKMIIMIVETTRVRFKYLFISNLRPFYLIISCCCFSVNILVKG